jgi:hypothetical protein
VAVGGGAGAGAATGCAGGDCVQPARKRRGGARTRHHRGDINVDS